MADRVVRAILTGDSASAVRAFMETSAAADKAGGDASKAMSGHSSNIDNALGNVGKSLAVMGAAAVATGIAVAGASLDMASKYDDATASMAAKAGLTKNAANAIGDAFLATAGTTTFSATEIMNAYGPVAAQLGTVEGHALGASDAMAVMDAAMNLAEGTGASLGDTTSALANVMQAYGLKVSDAGNASDLLFNSSTALNIPVSTLADTVDKLHAKLGPLSPSLSDTSTLLMDVSDHGLTGSRALMLVSTGLSTLLGGSKATNDEIKKLGINVYDASGNFVGMGTVIGELAPKLATMTEEQRLAAEKALFGAGASKALDDTIMAGLPAWDKAATAANKVGTAHAAATVATSTLSGGWDKLKAAGEDLGVKIGEVLMPVVTSLLTNFTNALPTIENVASKVLAVLVPAIQTLWSWFSVNLLPVIINVGSVLLNVASAVVPVLIGVLRGLFTGIGDVTTAAMSIATFVTGHWPELIPVFVLVAAAVAPIVAAFVAAKVQAAISAAAAAASWVASSATTAASFVATNIAATAQAVASSAAWVAQAAVASAAWVFTELPKIVAGFVTTAGAAVIQAVASSATWVTQAAVASAAWVTTQLPKIVRAFGVTAAAAIGPAAAAAAEWVKNAAIAALAWVKDFVGKMTGAFTHAAEAAAVPAAATGAEWSSAAGTAETAWTGAFTGILGAARTFALAMVEVLGPIILAIKAIQNFQASNSKGPFTAPTQSGGNLGIPGIGPGLNLPATGGATGMIINEPILGFGLWTGQSYGMGEGGAQEAVIPLTRSDWSTSLIQGLQNVVPTAPTTDLTTAAALGGGTGGPEPPITGGAGVTVNAIMQSTTAWQDALLQALQNLTTSLDTLDADVRASAFAGYGGAGVGALGGNVGPPGPEPGLVFTSRPHGSGGVVHNDTYNITVTNPDPNAVVAAIRRYQQQNGGVPITLKAP